MIQISYELLKRAMSKGLTPNELIYLFLIHDEVDIMGIAIDLDRLLIGGWLDSNGVGDRFLDLINPVVKREENNEIF